MDANRIFHCEYSGKAEGPGYELWREQFARHWLSTDFEPLAGDCFVNEVSATEHSFLGLCKMRSTPVRIERRSDAAAPGTRYVIVAASSPLRTHQCGRFVDLLPGEMSLLSADESARLDHLSDGDRWSIRMSHKLLRDVCHNVDDRISRPTGAPRDLTRLLLHQIEVAHRFGSKLDASANHLIAQHLLDLIALCFGAKGDVAHVAGRRGLAAARVDAIKAEILQRLADPNLTLTRIATRFGLSTRYVQYLFELAGTSFTGFVLEHRLLLAHRLLRDPVNGRRKISDIASTAGFADVSYFNRAFKNRFSETPTDVRAQVRSK